MATVTKRSETWSRDESQRQVLHPLQRLRGYIRLYVSAEGLAVLLIYLALWFWIGLVLDYGFFKAWGIDWVQELPRVLRVIVLFLLSAGLLAVVTVKVLFRMCREFRDTALALVLERRFHALLGDRLITAVEMADPKLATRYGYSQGMIDQTIREAAENVDRVPVREVFNWKRLGHYAGLVALLTLGVYILTGVGYCVFQRTLAVSRFVPRFNDVAQIWVERNILLKDTLWPRRAYLVLMNFPGEEMRIGRDAPPPTLHVRAYKWVIADDNQQQAQEGWRPLRWDEVGPLLGTDAVPSLPTTWQLRHRPESMALLGGSPQSSFPGNLPWVGLGVISREEEAVTVDEVDGQLDKFKVRHRHDGEDLPANWVLADTDPQKAPNGWRPLLWDDLKAEFIGVPIPQPPADWKAPEDNAALSADQVEARLDQPEVRRSLPAPAMETYRNVFTQLGMLSAMRRDVLDELEKLADAPHMSRRLRKLVIPAQVRVVLKGSTMSTEETLQRHENNEYSGTLPDLKESVRFTVRGEDYATPYKKITVVPPPDLVELVLDEDEPAYLYQRPPRNGTLEDLRGLKQQFRGRVVSLAGEKSSIDVPAGTDVWLTARVDKDLRLGGIHVLPQKGSEDVQAPIAQDGKKTFKTWFTNVTKPIDLVFEFTDTDKVTSQRHVLIKPTPDQPPEVEVQVEVLRKTGQGYLCTPWAFIPFSGKVRDDRGLSEVQYTYTLAPVEALPNPAITKATLAADLLPPDPGGVLGRLTALLLFDRSGQLGGDEENLPE
ncbi:MAG: hypothetical protein JO112_17325, partial [Planctomycetes bacterium]|nr:hypothetical protein [Planctomycetota bacterium]